MKGGRPFLYPLQDIFALPYQWVHDILVCQLTCFILPHFLRCKHIFFYLFHAIFIIVYAMIVSVSAMKVSKTQTESHRSAFTPFSEFLS